jgi:hypothetical protein
MSKRYFTLKRADYSGIHPAYYSKSTVCFSPEIKQSGNEINTQIYVASSLRTNDNVHLLHFSDFKAWTWKILLFTYTFR